ncbi:unnamed protein product, partial [Phyllotreta striolata]
MKLLVIFSVVFLIPLVFAAKTKRECVCFEEFEPEEEDGEALCRGVKHYRIFECGEEKPPRCECHKNGKSFIMDIGETNCPGTGDHLNCLPTNVWIQYYRRHPSRRRKLLLIFSVVFVIPLVFAAKTRKECVCFEEFEPEEENGQPLCRGVKNFRIFECGEEKPPRCECHKNGRTTIMDIGETTCAGKGDHINCTPTNVWNEYYRKHPFRRRY